MSSDFLLLAMPAIAVGAVAITGAAVVYDAVWRHPKKSRAVTKRAQRPAADLSAQAAPDLKILAAKTEYPSKRGGIDVIGGGSFEKLDLEAKLVLSMILAAKPEQDSIIKWLGEKTLTNKMLDESLAAGSSNLLREYIRSHADLAMDTVIRSVDPRQSSLAEALENAHKLMERARSANVDVQIDISDPGSPRVATPEP
jgi:hypothetical protein